MPKSSEIRSSRSAIWLGRLGGFLTRILLGTYRFEVRDEAGFLRKETFADQPVIFGLWHDQIGVLPGAFSRFFPWREAVALVSPSKDGSTLEAAFKSLGIGAVRGSSSRRGVAALIALRKAIKAGKDVGITPDGPKGPIHEVKPGIILLAAKSGAPIIPLRLEAANAWRLNSWDRFLIPKPFSRVKLTIGAPLRIPRDLSDAQMEEKATQLQQILLNKPDTPDKLPA